MSLTGIAKQTLAIVDSGQYVSPAGHSVVIRQQVDAAVRGTVLYRPDDLDALVAARAPRDLTPAAKPMRIEVTPETTAESSRRLVATEGESHVVALNFASAKNPGGGFLRGAKAQEEDLARCSALYTCQLTQRDYYDANRASGSMLYTDHIIYSPDVPFFRDDHLELLDTPFVVSIITAPAPNAGEALRRDRSSAPAVLKVLDTRAGKVLAVARAHDHRCLVLGAWGAGVFRNDPRDVADVFATWLKGPTFAGAFDRVVFAIYDRSSDRSTLRAFEERFASG